MRNIFLPVAAAAFTAFAAPAIAAMPAQVVTHLNVRAGPGTQYPIVSSVPAGGSVTVYGCLSAYTWCDVNWRGVRGWVAGRYLNYHYANRWQPIPSWGRTIGMPIITFSFGDYSHRHYQNRPWYHERYRWMDRNDRHYRSDWDRNRRDRDWRDNRPGRDRDGRDGRRDWQQRR